jgi:archaellum biogenesis protein FlaJ (TadC family)
MFSAITANEALLWQLASVSVAMFFATLLLVPMILIRLPSDYFSYRRRKSRASFRHPFVAVLLTTLKNLLGLIFVVAGIAMLVLPGQGILTILVGLMLLDFPGKYRAEQWMVSHVSVLRSINWIRAKAHKPPLAINLDGTRHR